MSLPATEAPAEAPPSEEALALARELVKRYYAKCFWFRHPDATIESRDDIYLVVSHLREYGGHKEWREAQRLWKCL